MLFCKICSNYRGMLLTPALSSFLRLFWWNPYKVLKECPSTFSSIFEKKRFTFIDTNYSETNKTKAARVGGDRSRRIRRVLSGGFGCLGFFVFLVFDYVSAYCLDVTMLAHFMCWKCWKSLKTYENQWFSKKVINNQWKTKHFWVSEQWFLNKNH